MLNSQLSIKGGIINIPVEIDEMVKVLPRPISQTKVIHLALKRKMSYKSVFKVETISPARICDALIYILHCSKNTILQ